MIFKVFLGKIRVLGVSMHFEEPTSIKKREEKRRRRRRRRRNPLSPF
jgi:hypothetical protein